MDILFQDQRLAKVCNNEYHPDYVSSPGETLLETLDTIGMSQVELAKRMGRPVKTINEIIQKKAAITAETALQLEQVLHIPASFWLKREQQYRESLARLAEEQRLTDWVEWLKEIPIREMMSRGWIPPCTNKPQQGLLGPPTKFTTLSELSFANRLSRKIDAKPTNGRDGDA